MVKGGGEGRDSVRVTTHGPCQCAATAVKHIRELPRKEGYSPLQPHAEAAEGGVEASRSERLCISFEGWRTSVGKRA